MFRKTACTLAVMATTAIATGCATEGSRALPITQTNAAITARVYQGPRSAISVGKFDNRSSFMRGLFSDGNDRLGSQAKTILISHLQQTGRFSVMDRDNLSETSQEAKFNKQAQNIKGANFVVTGDVTEFGRKEVGDQQLFGLLGRGKSQIAYAKVSLNIVDVNKWSTRCRVPANTACPIVKSSVSAAPPAMTPRSTARYLIWPCAKRSTIW
jgi:curli biogenesis system outer membrane secretion channel CsgG